MENKKIDDIISELKSFLVKPEIKEIMIDVKFQSKNKKWSPKLKSEIESLQRIKDSNAKKGKNSKIEDILQKNERLKIAYQVSKNIINRDYYYNKNSPKIISATGRLSTFYQGDFSDEDLNNINFKNLHMEDVIFRNTNLSGANFANSFIKNGYFVNVDLSNSNFYNAKLLNVEIEKSGLNNVNFSNSYLETVIFDRDGILNSNFSNLEATTVLYTGCNLINNNFDRINVDYLNFIDSKVINNYFKKSNIFSLESMLSEFNDNDFKSSNIKNLEGIKNIFRKNNFNKSRIKKVNLIENDLIGLQARKCDIGTLYLEKNNMKYVNCSSSNIGYAQFNFKDLNETIKLSGIKVNKVRYHGTLLGYFINFVRYFIKS